MLYEVITTAGWLALYSGLAGGGDIILLPELEYNIRSVCKKIEARYEDNKPYSIVVVAEGIEHPKGTSAASHIAEAIQTYTGIETRETVLGYIQRGGSPTPRITSYNVCYTKLLRTWPIKSEPFHTKY